MRNHPLSAEGIRIGQILRRDVRQHRRIQWHLHQCEPAGFAAGLAACRAAVCLGAAFGLGSAVALAAGTEAGAGTAAEPAEALRTRLLEEVAVTAQRRAEPLLGVPMSVAVVSSDLLERAGAGSLEQIQRSVPGFSFEKIQGYSNLAIRGVGGGGRNIGFETRTGVYLDDVYVGHPQALGLPLFDVERVEVLRGPQGYLFGRNTVSGAVHLVTREPTDELDLRLRARGGNWNLFEVAGRVSGPLAERMAGSLTATYMTRDGFTRNLYGGRLDDSDVRAARGRLRHTPGSATTIDVHADAADVRSNTIVTGEPVTDFFDTPSPELPREPRVVDINTPSFEDVRLRGANVTVTHDLAGGYTLTSVTGWRHTAQERHNDTDYARHDILWVDYRERFAQWSEELRLTASEGQLRWLAGVHALRETAHGDRRAVVGQDMDAVVPVPGGAMAPVGAAFRLSPGAVSSIDSRIRTSSLAVFGGVDYTVARALTVSVGLRYTNERKALRHDLDGSQSGAFAIAVVPDYRDRRSDSALTPSLGLLYAAAPNINVYAAYRSGFKGGGWNLDFLTSAQAAAGFSFAKEAVDAYEVGLKADLSPLSLEATLFQADYSDHQVFHSVRLPSGQSVFVLANAARARARGAELSLRSRLTSRLTLAAQLALIDARYRAFPDGGGLGVDLDGNRLQAAPRSAAAVAADYLMAVGAGEIALHASYSHRAHAYMQPTNQPLDRLDRRNLVDARLTWRPGLERAWDLSVWARNLLDREYLTRRGRDFLGNQYVKFGDPRTVGLELSYRL